MKFDLMYRSGQVYIGNKTTLCFSIKMHPTITSSLYFFILYYFINTFQVSLSF
jgi:hypothetical protein